MRNSQFRGKSLSDRAEDLLRNFLFQKQRLMERAGTRKVYDWEISVTTWGQLMEDVAQLTSTWEAGPGVLMEAAFAQAARQRHPNGPMPNMLKSEKYLVTALSNHLEIPIEAVKDRQSMSRYFDSMDEAYSASTLATETNPDRILLTTTEPVTFKFLRLMEVSPGHARLCYDMLLKKMASDARVSAWMERKGYDYAKVAETGRLEN